MSQNYPIHFIAEPTEADHQVIFDGINQFARSCNINAAAGSYFFAAYDDQNRVVGAISGFDNFGVVEIGGLWVAEPLRGKGYGTALLQRAEKWGREKGCQAISVFTLKSWPSYTWYQKQLFQTEFMRSCHTNGTTGCYLIKKL